MKKLLEMIASKAGTDESIIQLMEECAELIQAASKYRRALKGTTPVSLSKAQANLIEEMADVRVCISEMAAVLDGEFSHDTEQQLEAQQQNKIVRWCKRLGIGV